VRRRRLLWQLYASYLLITLGALAAVLWYGSEVLQGFQRAQTQDALEARARLAVPQVAGPLRAGDAAAVNALCAELRRQGDARFTVMMPDGTVLGDSDEDPARMENHAQRPEMAAALDGRLGVDVRHSVTLQQDMMYVAVPVRDGDRVIGVARAALPLAGLQEALHHVYRHAALVVVAIGLLAAIVSLLVSRWIARPLVELQRGAERFAQGNLEHKVPLPDSAELAALADAMNTMAAHLGQRIDAVERQRNELEAILGSMAEGVVAVDTEQHVLSMNAAAGELLDCDPARAVGRSIQEVVRNPGLHNIMARAQAAEGRIEGDLTVAAAEGDRFLQARATILRDPEGAAAGTLLVLNDVTRLRRLESLRREFVANVSHELRTPITVIKGFAETLVELGDEDPVKARRFLDIIAGQADRLQTLFDDLLILSRTEQQTERGEIVLKEGPVADLVESAVELCRARAADKGVTIEAHCAEDVTARVSASLLEQAVFNLVDNAVRYSPGGTLVTVEVARAEREVTISVRDQGIGIAPEHLPRIFERFYRVDNGRDRKTGGTGLGLAIVKHVVQAHGGRVTVQSTPGKGSTFTIHLPAA
jgi:two-component system phosphate regulon sensor histidine kinase PhoR